MKKSGVKERMIVFLFLFLLMGSMGWAGPLKGSVQKLPSKRVLPPTVRGLEPMFSDLSIEGISCRGCTIAILIKNLGPGGLHTEDRQRGKLILELAGFSASFSLKNVDPHQALSQAGGQVRFKTKFPCAKRMRVTVRLKGLKYDGVRGKKTLTETIIPHPMCKSERKKPSFQIPLRLTTKFKGCENELRGLKGIVERLSASRTIRKKQAMSFRKRTLAYASKLKEAFDITMKEVKRGYPWALVEFENMVKAHEREVGKIVSMVRALEEKIKKGEIIPHKQWLKQMSPSQRELFLKSLTPEGRRIIKKAFPELFQKRTGLLRKFLKFFSIRSVEAKIAEPCIEVCDITYEETLSLAASQEAAKRFWEEASEECKQCVYDNNIPFKFMMAWKKFQNCYSECQRRILDNPVLGFLQLIECIYQLIVTVA